MYKVFKHTGQLVFTLMFHWNKANYLTYYNFFQFKIEQLIACFNYLDENFIKNNSKIHFKIVDIRVKINRQ